MLRIIEERTEIYKKNIEKQDRKEKGQFFTPAAIAKEMTTFLNEIKATSAKILDPGAGNGILSVAAVEVMIKNGCKKITLDVVETDEKIIPLLEENMREISRYCRDNNAEFEYHLIRENFLLNHNRSCYDIVICNPPYKKIRKDSLESKAMLYCVHGQPNLYGLFMVKGMELLKESGIYIYITPRSWTSGKYFRKIREILLANINIKKIDLFSSRNKVFHGEEVLQETMILYGYKGKRQQEQIQICPYVDGRLKRGCILSVKASIMKNIGKDGYLLLPETKDDEQTIACMAEKKDTFHSLGYQFKTGPVVEFRAKDKIHVNQQTGDIPMYRSLHIKKGKFVYPADTEKAQYLSGEAKQLFVKNQNMILIRRLSTKEDTKRLQLCRYYKKGEYPYISIENHVNYLVRSDGKELSRHEMEWLYQALTSEDYERYFRMFNGSTQVNAGELNLLPLERDK